MSEAIQKWECGRCGELHDDEDEAGKCCQPVVNMKWECSECGKVYDDEGDAKGCCANSDATESHHVIPRLGPSVSAQAYIAEFEKLNHLKA